MALRTGAHFLAGLQDGREIWLEGERVANVVTHPKLARMAATLAGVYDLQHRAENQEHMSFKSPSSGQPAALSYIIPRSQEDLLARRKALEIVAADSFGMLGRTPDYVNIQLTSMRQMARLYGCNNPRYGDNLVQYHEYVRERDLCLTHAFGHPQVNRGLAVSELADKYTAMGVVDTTNDGVIVRGAKQLATLAPFSDEIFCPVYRPLNTDSEDEKKYCVGFSIPVNTPGLKFICRQSHDFGESLYDYPLSGRYDEMDALAVFEDVLIPWDRVFQFEDMELANLALQAVPMWRQYMQQVAVKNIAKLEFILGITHRIALGIGIEVFSHVQEKIAEIVDILETVRSYLRAAEADAAFHEVNGEVNGLKGEKIEGEGIWPAPEPWIAMRNWYPDAYVRVIWIVEQLAAGGLMLTPTEQDVHGELAEEIGKFYSGANLDATERIALFRLAWDLTGTQFGSRQTLYERFFNGDVVRLRQRRFATYDYTRATKAVDTFLARDR